MSSSEGVRRDAERNTPEARATTFSRATAAEILEQIISADGNWPAKRKTVLRKPLEDLFDDAAFLASLAPSKMASDPLAEDWDWVRGHMTALLRLAQNSARFAARKRDDGVLDFHDLEQFALKAALGFCRGQTNAVAERWREKIRFVFVDEYQDINAAQDKIIQALSRDLFGVPPSGGKRPKPPEGGTPNTGNRFLVGDVKQSIYRFRLADPKIFRDYARNLARQKRPDDSAGRKFPQPRELARFREFRFRAAHARGNRRRELRRRGAVAIRRAGTRARNSALPKSVAARGIAVAIQRKPR